MVTLIIICYDDSNDKRKRILDNMKSEYYK